MVHMYKNIIHIEWEKCTLIRLMISQFVVAVRNKLQLNLARKAINMSYGKSKGRLQKGKKTNKPSRKATDAAKKPKAKKRKIKY